jgi:Tol biopolymer transport system component
MARGLLAAAISALLVSIAGPATASDADDAAQPSMPWIAYQALFDGAVDLGLVHADGSADHRLPGGPGNRWHPDWSPDGTQMAYDWNLPDDVSEIAVVNVDGSDDHVLLHCVDSCLGNGGPAWSPDGMSIAFDGAEGPTEEHAGDLCYLAILTLDSGAVNRFIEQPDCAFGDSYLRFSPDGQRVVFQREGPEGMALFTATLDGQEQQQLTDWGFGARPDWSPDGKWIVFMSTSEDGRDSELVVTLHRIRPDGTGLEALTGATGEPVRDVYPRYLPDGSGVLFNRCSSMGADCETRLIDVDGAHDRLLLEAMGRFEVHVVWQPTPSIQDEAIVGAAREL